VETGSADFVSRDTHSFPAAREWQRFPDQGTIIMKAINNGVDLFNAFDFLKSSGNVGRVSEFCRVAPIALVASQPIRRSAAFPLCEFLGEALVLWVSEKGHSGLL